MGRRPATIRDANAAKACVDAVARRHKFFQSVAAFAILLLLLCAPMLRAQSTPPALGTVSGVSNNALAINSNNSAGQAYNAVLNTDSSVSLLQDGAILGTVVCAPYTVLGASITVSTGAIFVDSANSRIYLAMIAGGAVYAAYESFNQTAGTCTPGPLLTLTTNALSNLEMNVDPLKGNVYILNSFGAFPDTLYILPIASWSASSAAKLNMDYSAQYGPIVIDPSNDVVYVNDLGGSTAGTVGTYSTSGFFVYDPNFSATPANNLQHVVGYNASGGMPPTPFYVGTLLSNGAGKLVLVNENPSASSTNLSVPITILNTTAPQSLFFTNTTNPYSYNNDVDITPGTALSTISAVSQYKAISGADINAANNLVYVFGFNSSALTTPGLVLEYNLSPTASPQETVLSSSTAMPNLGYSVPWIQMSYNTESTELALSAIDYGSGALALTSPLCVGTPLSLAQVAGSAANPSSIGYPVVNTTSGYVYAIQSGGIDYVAPPPGCTASTPIQISPATITYGFAGESYFENFTATGGSGTGYTWSVTSGTALSAVGLSLTTAGVISGSPNAAETAVPFTVQVIDSHGNTSTQNYTLTIYPDFTVLPSSLSAGTVGTAYSQMFTATGGSGGPYSFSVASGTALSAVGLTLSTGGLISGTPSLTETAAPLTIQVADSLGDFTQLNYTLTISSASSGPITINDPETVTVNDSETQVQLVDVSDPETITVTDTPVVTVNSPLTFTGPGSLPSTDINANYTFTITAGGGLPPYTFTAVGLPAGLSIATNTGTISGTPIATGPFSFSLTVTDSASNANSSVFSLTVDPALTFGGPASLPSTDLNANYTFTITAAGGLPPYTFTAAGLPAGLSIGTNTGTLSGTPIATGFFSFTVTVVDANQVTTTKNVSLTVDPALTFGGPASLPAGEVGEAYPTTTITANGGLPPYNWIATGLPTGLTIGGATGTISGIPTTAPGAYAVKVTVQDSTGLTAIANYSLTVTASPPLAITGPSSLPDGDVGEAYTPATISATGGSGVYTWSATGLPVGLSIGSTTGTITGTTNTAGAYYVTVNVEDANGITASTNYTLTVVLPSVMVSANPNNITIVQGQTGETTITLTPQGNYTGTFTLSVSDQPANTSSVFTLNGVTVTSVTLTGNNQTVNVVLAINTDVISTQAHTESAPTPLRPGAILTAIAFWCPGSLLGLIALRRKRKLFTKNPGILGLCVVALLVGTLAGLAGCISGGGFGTYVTPAGTSTVTVVATPGSGSAQTLNIGLTIKQQ